MAYTEYQIIANRISGNTMRPNGRSETDSLYFSYPYFDAPTGDKRPTLNHPTPVAIVGAGPIGMTAALALASEGIRSVILDKKSTFNDGSRAICIARSSFYILQNIGAIDAFLEKSLGWTTGRTFYQGKLILEFHMQDGPDEKYRPMYNLQQQYIEQFLWDAVVKNPLIDARWQSEVVGIENIDGGARLSVLDSEGSYLLAADYVLACDGARSAIRTLRSQRLEGENLEGRYVIADVQMNHDYPTIRRALFDPACRPKGTVLIHKQPDNIWRIDYQLRDDETTEEALQEKTVRLSVASVLKDIEHSSPWELEWWSVYSANTLALENYRDGPVFFVGDSAHIVPIFGVRGLNNGLADAANIAWKLSWVLNGKAGKALLDSYSPERRGATFDVFENASKSARFMTPNTHGWRIMRDAALSLALTHPFAGKLANPRQMTPYSYSDSPAVVHSDDEISGGPAIGAVVADIKVDRGVYLSDQLTQGFTILCFDEKLAERLKDAFALESDVGVIKAPYPSTIAKRYSAGRSTAYLVRPDWHIAGRWLNAKPETVLAGYRAVTFQEEQTS
ncbi:MAG: 3-(3-hydroxy-phenyl)propionate hydroxylase [Granulosicoccus sp.]